MTTTNTMAIKKTTAVFKENVMTVKDATLDEIMNKINLLEEELAEEEYCSYAYDCIDAKLQVLYNEYYLAKESA